MAWTSGELHAFFTGILVLALVYGLLDAVAPIG